MPVISAHVRIHAHCGACNFAFACGDSIIAVCYLNGCGPVAVNAYTFRRSGNCEQGAQTRWLFCRKLNCNNCVHSEESATIHTDCYNLFRERGGTLHQLWRAGTWNRPWRSAPTSQLRPEVDLSLAMVEASKLIHEPQQQSRLLSLPLELAQVIWGYAQPSLLSRFLSTVELADFLTSAGMRDNAKEVSFPLAAIRGWERGDSLPTLGASRKRLVRLTFDVRGLRRIERVGEEIAAFKSASQNREFVVEDACYLSNVVITYQYGIGSLRVPPRTSFPIRDLPVALRTRLIPTPLLMPTRLATIDTNTCTGLTFFIALGVTYAIHSHTLRDPSAIQKFTCLSPRRQPHTAWVYVPFARDDDLRAFGIRRWKQKICEGPFVFWYMASSYVSSASTGTDKLKLRTARSGDFSVGPWDESASEDFVARTCLGSTLIYDLPGQDGINAIGVHPDVPGIATINTPIPSQRSPFRSSCFSSASLENVRKVTIYQDENDACKGLLFEYNDDSKRAIGQCRIGLDSLQEYTEPTGLWYLPSIVLRPGTEYQLHVVKVEVGTKSESRHALPHWRWCNMVGRIEMWFTAQETMLNIVA